MQLVEKHDFHKGSRIHKQLDVLCWLSKNLYNSGLYTIRQYFFQTQKFLSYAALTKMFAETNQPDYRQLPAKVAQQTLKLLQQNFQSFFALLDKKSKGKYNQKVKIPQYLDKVNGRQVVHYTKQAISTVKKSGYVNLSKTNIFIKTKQQNIQFVRIVPKAYKITVEIGYTVETLENNKSYNRYAGIDLGLNNLATVTFFDSKPFIINGKPVKSINQFYNKIKAKLMSYSPLMITNKLLALRRKRDNKINDYLHKSSRWIVNQLVSRNITDLVIGHNAGWKQGINIGKRNNQNFVFIPFMKFIHMIQYKCALKGISVHLIDESYTSKASFLDNDYIPDYKSNANVKHTFSGCRKYRGLYVSAMGSLNADVNGSLNIMRKFFQYNPDRKFPKYIFQHIKSSPKVTTYQW